MSFLHMDPYPQQFYSNNASNCPWPSPTPQDSGYASEPNDLFAKAFQTQFPTHTQQMQPQQYAPNYTYTSPPQSPTRPALRHQQSMPVLPFSPRHSNAYDSLNARAAKLSIDAGINTLTGYCDFDSLMAAAYNNTCTTQTQRFQSFASANSSPSRNNSQPMVSPPLTPPALIREPAFPELERAFTRSDEDSKSFFPPMEDVARPERRGRASHTQIEQRYRQNIVSQFKKLAETLPHIETSQPARAGQEPKPSKAEILAAASEYIVVLERENERLRGLVG